MTRILLLAACATSISFPAFATNNPPRQGNNTAQAGAVAVAGAAAGASNRTTVRNTNYSTNLVDQRQRASATGGTSQGNSVVYNAPGDQRITTQGTTTVRSAPDVAAPAIWSNNPCIISASGSVSVVGFGASLGAGIEDKDCTRRALAQLLSAMGYGPAAREVLCANREVRAAFLSVGQPCVADVRVQSVSVTPTRAPESLPTMTVATISAPVETRAWCQPAARESVADRLMREANCR